MKHSTGAIICILIHLIMMLKKKWQNESFAVSVPCLHYLSCCFLSCSEQYRKDRRMFRSWAGGLTVLYFFPPVSHLGLGVFVVCLFVGFFFPQVTIPPDYFFPPSLQKQPRFLQNHWHHPVPSSRNVTKGENRAAGFGESLVLGSARAGRRTLCCVCTCSGGQHRAARLRGDH